MHGFHCNVNLNSESKPGHYCRNSFQNSFITLIKEFQQEFAASAENQKVKMDYDYNIPVEILTAKCRKRVRNPENWQKNFNKSMRYRKDNKKPKIICMHRSLTPRQNGQKPALVIVFYYIS